MKITILLCVLLITLAACAGGSDAPPVDAEDDEIGIDYSRYYLDTRLMPSLVPPWWTLRADTLDLQERQSGLVMTGGYDFEQDERRASGRLTLSVYRTPADARQAYDAQVASWGERAEQLPAFGDAAAILGEADGGVVLVDADAIALVEIDAPGGVTRLEMLSLLQKGLDVLSERRIPSPFQGQLGSATLAPPPVP